MCMNCGCGEPNERHKPTDITADDVKKAADGSGMSFEQATRNMRTSLDTVKQPAGQQATSR